MAKNLTAESLNLLLAKFSADERQAVAAYAKLRDSLTRFFELKGDFEPSAATDETLDRAAFKLAEDTPIENFTSYCFGIARLVFLERQRLERKEKKAVADFHDRKTAVPLGEETDDFQFFRECFRNLPETDRIFLQKYFSDAPYQKLVELRRRLMTEMRFSVGQMQVRVFRLRKRLENCVHEKIKNN